MQRTRSTVLFIATFAVYVAMVGVKAQSLTPDSGAPKKTPVAARIERGAHLVRTMGCNDCHTPWKMGPRGPEPDLSRALIGHPQDLAMPPAPELPKGPWAWVGAATNTAFAGPWGVSFTANLTPDVETGLGRWTESMFIETMRTGRHEGKGRKLLPPMPYWMVGALSDEDIKSLFAYLQSLTPVRNRVPQPIDPPTEAVEAAPPRLSETGLYEPGRVGAVDRRNRPFSPQYPLWSDGAIKTRWAFLPSGTTIDAEDDSAWEFPVGTRFWKEFAFNGRKVETRMLWKATASKWIAASYVWNEEQTDATLASSVGEPDVAPVSANRRHSIPAVSDCLACHGTRRTEPLGFNPLQLSTDRDPNAIHGEPLPANALTLRTLVGEKLLSPNRAELIDEPPRIRTASISTRRMLGYFSTNCGSCHRGDGEMAVNVPSLRYSELMRDGDAVASSLIGRTTAWRVPGAQDERSVLIDPAAPELSAMLVRMRSRSPSSQMPPLGTVLRDRAAVEAMAQWISEELAARRD
jgi:mono/diheme cytochrome c family protein